MRKSEPCQMLPRGQVRWEQRGHHGSDSLEMTYGLDKNSNSFGAGAGKKT